MNNIEKQRIIVRQIAERLNEVQALADKLSFETISEAVDKYPDFSPDPHFFTMVRAASESFKRLADDEQFWNMIHEDHS